MSTLAESRCDLAALQKEPSEARGDVDGRGDSQRQRPPRGGGGREGFGLVQHRLVDLGHKRWPVPHDRLDEQERPLQGLVRN